MLACALPRRSLPRHCLCAIQKALHACQKRLLLRGMREKGHEYPIGKPGEGGSSPRGIGRYDSLDVFVSVMCS